MNVLSDIYGRMTKRKPGEVNMCKECLSEHISTY